MDYTKFKIVLLVLCFGLLAAIIGCSEKTAQDGPESTDKTDAPVDSLVIELVGVDSTSVFDLLKSQHEIEFKSSSMGNLVTMIDSVIAGGNYYWFYSVNDSMASVACDQYFISEGDTVRWYFRKVGQ